MKFLLILSVSLLLISCNKGKENIKKEDVKKEVVKKDVKKDIKKEVVKKDIEKENIKDIKDAKKKKIEYKILTSETVLGSYNGTDIKLKEIQTKYSKELDQFNQKAILERYDKEKLKVSSYAQNLLLLETAKEKGFKTTKKLLESLVKNIKKPLKKDIQAFMVKYAQQLKGMDEKKIQEIAIRSLQDKEKTAIIENFVLELVKSKNFKVTFPYPSGIPELKIDIKNSPVLGKADAKYTIVEFSDFQCPYCSRVVPEVEKVVKDNPNVKLVFKHFPLSFHPVAFNAAVATVCAKQQGKFWEYHDMLFKNQKTLSDENITKYAKNLKLDMRAFEICIKSPAATKLVKNDMKIAESLGIQGTPTLFLNGVKINAMNEKMILDEIESLKNRVVGKLTDETVIASFDNKTIKWADFKKDNPYFQVISDRKRIKKEHEFYFQLFSKYLSEKMLMAEVKETGAKDIQEYMSKKLATITPASEDELKKIYEQIKPKLGGKTYEEVKVQLVGYAQQLKQREFTQKEMTRLAKKYKAKLNMPAPLLPKLNLITKGFPFMGKEDAPNILIAYSEFQCPYCKRFGEFSEKLIEKYPNKLKIVFKHFPLDFHPQAMNAAIAAQCAFKQNKFKSYHHLLFQNQSEFSAPEFKKEKFTKWAKDLKLDEALFIKCINNPETKKFIDNSVKEGMSLEVQGTPTLFLNGEALQLKDYSVDAFEQYLK